MPSYPLFDTVGGPLLAALFLFLLWRETRRPLRARAQSRWRRLVINGAVSASAALVLRLLLIPVVLWVAWEVERRGFGLVRVLPVPPLVQGALAFVLLDYSMYGWHWLNHRVPFLWRFHNVHHTDLDLDVSTAFRFHFGELLLSVFERSFVVALIGAGPIAVLVFEVALEAATAFHHSNWRLPLGLERALNRVLVTPRMHGIHHSIVRRETDSNWSVIFSFWDRLHKTARLDIPQEAITVGVPGYRKPEELTIFDLLALPFRRQRPWQLPDGTEPERKNEGDRLSLAP